MAGTPNGESCTNTQYTPGISTHLFPSEPTIVLGLNGLSSFVDIVLILVSQSANLHLCDLCVQLILSRVALPTAWRLRCQEWKELNYDFSKSVENRDFWPNGKDKQTMKCDVPQGSSLGPLLFLLYMNDISNYSDKLNFKIFADDTCLCFITFYSRS